MWYWLSARFCTCLRGKFLTAGAISEVDCHYFPCEFVMSYAPCPQVCWVLPLSNASILKNTCIAVKQFKAGARGDIPGAACYGTPTHMFLEAADATSEKTACARNAAERSPLLQWTSLSSPRRRALLRTGQHVLPGCRERGALDC